MLGSRSVEHECRRPGTSCTSTILCINNSIFHRGWHNLEASSSQETGGLCEEMPSDNTPKVYFDCLGYTDTNKEPVSHQKNSFCLTQYSKSDMHKWKVLIEHNEEAENKQISRHSTCKDASNYPQFTKSCSDSVVRQAFVVQSQQLRSARKTCWRDASARGGLADNSQELKQCPHLLYKVTNMPCPGFNDKNTTSPPQTINHTDSTRAVKRRKVRFEEDQNQVPTSAKDLDSVV